MLQSIAPHHDAHHTRAMSTSLASLTTSMTDGKKHVLLAASGSVATIKLPQIIQALASRHGSGSGSVSSGGGSGLSIRVILTQSASHFLAGQSAEQPTLSALSHLPCVDAVYSDADEWGPRPWRRGGGILHIELRRWADILVIAPLSANTLAKIANGLCDNLLTSVVRAWDTDGAVDGQPKRIVVCPAMNTAMWRHPVTARQVRTLEKDWGVVGGVNGGGDASAGAAETNGTADGGGQSTTSSSGATRGGGWFVVMPPQQKMLACGDVGVGGMADWGEIVKAVEANLGLTSTAG